jgi:glycosyltransferase involved in cell wall biosynthesis
MRVSVFTPSHNPRYLNDCYASLAGQSLADWEWIVLLNGKITHWDPPVADPRVRVERVTHKVKGVGAAKRIACERATGEVLVELDHDDRLSSDCLESIAGAFVDQPSAVLAFSDFTQINADGSPNFDKFDVSNGWVYSAEMIDGVEHLRCHALQASPHNVG